MNFILQFRNAASDEPLLEVTSPLPLQVPRKGDQVELHDGTKKIAGAVHSVLWAYQPVADDPQHDSSLDILARVWITAFV